MNSDELIAELNKQKGRIETMIAFLQTHKARFEALGLKLSRWTDKIDFDRLKHPDVMRVVQAFPGKWTKTLSADSGRIDYETSVDGVSLRVWSGEPPPNCRIVEEDVYLPAQTVKRFKLVCVEERQEVNA